MCISAKGHGGMRRDVRFDGLRTMWQGYGGYDGVRRLC